MLTLKKYLVACLTILDFVVVEVSRSLGMKKRLFNQNSVWILRRSCIFYSGKTVGMKDLIKTIFSVMV